MAVSTAEVTAIRSAYDDVMADTCLLGSETAIGGTWTSPNANSGTWTYGTAEVSCGVNLGKSEESVDNGQSTLTDAAIRLPIDTSITGLQ